MARLSGNQFRQSSVETNDIIENLPNLFPVEQWRAFYWALDKNGHLVEGRAVLHLPRGLSAVTPALRHPMDTGAIEHVRRWGVALRGGIFEDLGLDLTPLLSHDRKRFVSDDAEALHLMTMLTHFDLPGYFIIASEEHPFLLFDSAGDLKGRYTRWFTHAGALAYLISDGKMRISFDLIWREDRRLYAKVMQWLNEELANRKGEQD